VTLLAVQPNPRRWGHYEVVGQLGEGSYGAVYEAIDVLSEQRVALKELLRSSAGSLALFKQEFRALADIHHPNLVAPKELFEHHERWFIAMELVEGTDLLSWVRGEPRSINDTWSFDPNRLCQVFQDVAEGLSALHGHGVLHRDLKPSNVRVRPDGRAVLLDFGLATSLDRAAQSTDGGGAGTPAYMAPEQVSGTGFGPEADWYAFGSCLYEVLTGRLPFEASSPMQIMINKQGRRPEPPTSVAKEIPAVLDELCLALLDPEPRTRAGYEVVQRALSAQRGALGHGEDLRPPATHNPLDLRFRGREAELDQLLTALARTEGGAPRIVLVEGESGVGKSTLVHEFMRRVRDEHERAIVLRGRCYENEQVPYKAFDGCIDELARVLRRLPRDELLACIPRRGGLLPQLFPVLRVVPELASASSKGVSADPTARRLEAFGALAALLGKLAEDRPFVLFIDDLQWADAESFRLLRALVESSDPPPVLIVSTVRPRGELTGELAERMAQVRAFALTSVVPVTGLPAPEARAMAAQLLGSHAPPAWLAAIERESKGHPLWIAELVQHVTVVGLDATGSLSLDAALRTRIGELGSGARALLDVVALSSRPHSEQLFRRALGGPAGFGDATKVLLAAKLLTRRGSDQLTTYHDYVRRAALDMLAPAKRTALHAVLARALHASTESDSAEQAYHWDEGQERARAATAYARAADEALEMLAFSRAEELYARAIALLPDPASPEAHRLLVQRGHALARAGRSAEAAASYRLAAHEAEGEERIRLRIWATQHLIQSAQVAEGLASAREILEQLGTGLPRSTASALARLAWDRGLLGIRGFEVQAVETSAATAADRLELEALQELSFPVSWVDLLPGAALNTRYIRRALALGEPRHVARALMHEAAFRAMQTPMDYEAYRPLLERARVLSERDGTPALRAYLAWNEGAAAWMRHDFATSVEVLEQGHRILLTECPGEVWLLTNTRMQLTSARWFMGDHAQFALDATAWLAEAEERRDDFARAALTGIGFGFSTHLMADCADEAVRAIREAQAPWPSEPFGLAQLGETMAMLCTGFYQGGPAARDWLQVHERKLSKAFVLRTMALKTWLHSHTCSAALSACEALPVPERTRELQEIERRARALALLPAPHAEALSAVVLAQIYALRGDEAATLEQTRRAEQLCAARGLRAWVEAMRYLDGITRGGDAGRASRELSIAYFREQGWKDPERAVAMFAPATRVMQRGTGQRAPTATLIDGRYRFVRVLHESALGSVSEVEDSRTGRTLMLRELRSTSPATLARFKHEFRALSSLHHPNLLRLETLFQHEGIWYVATEHIEGTDFLSWVRPEDHLDETRLSDALMGLLRGVAALHEAGFIHRDINPDNVRVTADGRVVLLDFGLMAPADVRDRSVGEGAVGTIAYVAPEQIDRDDFDATADVYAIGACLYQALTDMLPFDHLLSDQVLRAKRRGRPVPPYAMQIEVPSDLEELALAMLERDPHDRPSAPAALAKIEGRSRTRSTSPRVSVTPGKSSEDKRAAFAGRDEELTQLAQQFEQARAGRGALTIVEGESGVGKTSLVNELLQRIQREHPNAIILRARCYVNEQIALQAFDAAFDELAKALRKLPRRECEALLPPRAALLPHVFPVLGSVAAISEASVKGVPAEPVVRRKRALETLCSLLARMHERGPVIIAIDDLQWADAESFELLEMLTSRGETGAGWILATLRDGEARDSDVARALETAKARGGTSLLALRPLDHEAALKLACSLGGEPPESPVTRMLVRESGGHPLFMRELSSFAREYGGTAQTASALTLDAALAARLRTLAAASQELLELVALAGRPYPSTVFERAVGRASVFGSARTELLAHELLRVRDGDELVCYHDRIRELCLKTMSQERVAQLSLRLAPALDADASADARDRARLWEHAADAVRASDAYAEAGEQALTTLQFNRAERFYGRALALRPGGVSIETRGWQVQRGQALARSGRSREAATLFLACAATAEGEERVRLRIWATQHLIQSAQVEQGLLSARELFSELGLPLTETTAGALSRIVWDRTCIGVRGLEVNVAPEKRIDVKARLRLEALYELSGPLSWAQVLPGAAVNTHHLRLSLASGESEHVARALAHEATFRALQKPLDTAAYEPLLTRARTLAGPLNEPSLDAFLDHAEATAASFRFDLVKTQALCTRGYDVIETRCPDSTWLRMNLRMQLGSTAWLTGAFRDLASRTSEWMQEAEQRGDDFARTAQWCLGFGFASSLMQDRPEEALSRIEDVMRCWPREPFAMAHMGELFATYFSSCYAGGAGAQRWMEAHAAQLDSAFVLRTKSVLAWHLFMRAGAALAACACETGERRHALLREAIDRTAKLDHVEAIHAKPLALLMRAQIAVREGEPNAARGHVQAAVAGLDALGLHAYVHAARYLQGTLDDSDESRALREQSLRFFGDEGWQNPARAIRMLVPATHKA